MARHAIDYPERHAQTGLEGLDGGDGSQPGRPGEMSEKGAPTENGVIVEVVPAGSAVDGAGLQPGDLLLDVNGQDVGDTDRLRLITSSCKPGQRVKLSGLRNQRKVEFTLSCVE